MELTMNNGFSALSFDEMMEMDGGCWLCKLGSTIGGAGTGAGTVLALASNPAGWVVAGGAVIGGGLGYLLAS